MGWLIALLVLVVLAILPLGASIVYDANGPLIRVLIGPFRVQVYPLKKKKEKPKTEKKPAKKKTEPKPAAEKEKKQGGSISDFYPFINLVFDLLSDFGRKLRLDIVEIKIVLAGDDPADLGINYGRAWTALGTLWPMLEEIFVIKKRTVEVECDFESSKTTIAARLDLTITLGRLFSLGIRYGIRGLREFIKFTNKRKAGTTK